MRRLLLVGLACLASLVVLAAAGIYWFLSGDGIRTALEHQATAWLGQPVHVSSARVEFLPRLAIRLDGVTVGEPAQVTLAEVAVSTALRALLGGRIADAEVRIRDSRLDLPLPFALPSSAAPESGATDGATLAIRRGIHPVHRTAGRDHCESRPEDSGLCRLVAGRHDPAASTVHCGIGKDVDQRRRAPIELEPRVDATLEVNANRIDLDELLALADAFSGSAPSGPPATRQHRPTRHR